MRNKLFLVAVALFSSSVLYGQHTGIGSPVVTNFSRSDYQAGTQNWAIQQGENGLMYFANNKGILEFDGTNWTTMALPNRTIVRSLRFGQKGQLFVGGQNEFGYLKSSGKTGSTYTSLTHLVPTPLHSFGDVWEIFTNGGQVIFCSEKAIFIYDGQQLEALPAPKDGRFTHFFQVDDVIWAQDLTYGLFKVASNARLNRVADPSVFGNQIAAILPHAEYDALLLTAGQGFFAIEEEVIRPLEVEVNGFLRTNRAYCATLLRDGNYAIGTTQNGLLIMHPDGTPALHLNKQKGLQNNTVLSLMEDQQRNLWLALDNGIDYAEIGSAFWNIREEDGLTGTGYASMMHNGQLYLGTNQGLYFCDWHPEAPTLDRPSFQLVDNGLGQVWSINRVGEDIIVGQHKGMSVLKDNRLVPVSNTQGVWKFMPLQAHPGYALKGTYVGFHLYRRAPDGSWQPLGKIKGFDDSARVYEEDEDGHIWVSHAYLGVFRLELDIDALSAKRVIKYDATKGLTDSLMVNVAKIRGEMIFTGPGGIYGYDQEKDAIHPHTDYSRIFGQSHDVHRLIEDYSGNIWFAISKDFGVLRIEEKGVINNHSQYYYNQIQEELVDGFEHVQTYEEEHVFIGSEKGFVYFQPKVVRDTTADFRVLVREVVLTTERDSTLYAGVVEQPVGEDWPVYAHQYNDFRFTFSAPYYEKIDYLYYRFQLAGFDERWSEWSPKTEKEYTNLQAGDYTFRIQARNAYGQLSEVNTFHFSVSPPWYKSWWARVGYLCLCLLIMIGIYQYISLREGRKTAAFKERKTVEMEQKEAAFKKEVEKSESEIIKLRNEKLHNDIQHRNSQLASATMHLVQKSEILSKIKNDLKSIQSQAEPELKKKLRYLVRTIESDIQLDESWEQFEAYFDQVHENFLKRLRETYPQLTPKDQKLCAYLRMNLTTKEIAPLLNISVRGVEISRYRLRKKLGLSSEVNLVGFILKL